MSKIFFYIVSTIFFSQTLISQQIDHINGGAFSKRIEYNLLYWEPMYNLDSKRDYEKLSSYARNQKDSIKAISDPDQLPQFPGGEKALLEYLAANIHPMEVLYSSLPIRGIVMVRFVVSETGKTGEIEITRSLNPMLDAEVIRVIQSMPDWIPGKNKGKTVPVYMNLPVRF